MASRGVQLLGRVGFWDLGASGVTVYLYLSSSGANMQVEDEGTVSAQKDVQGSKP